MGAPERKRRGCRRIKRTEKGRHRLSSGQPTKKRKTEKQSADKEKVVGNSEALAETAVRTGDFSQDTVLRVLRQLDVPANFTRKNVMPVGADFVRGQLLGLYSYGGSLGVASGTVKHPWVTRLLIGALRCEAPDFPFTSIQINYDYASRPHVDKSNLGTSYILGLGDYTGGEVWVHDEDGSVPFTLEGEEDVNAFYHVGRELPGVELQVRGTWTMFNGNQLHFTRPFEGERYSIIFFTVDRFASTPPEVRTSLRDKGFNFDWDAENLQKILEEKHQQQAQIAKEVAQQKALEDRRELLHRGRCIGRVWANGWGLRCTAVCTDGYEFCGSHLEKERWRTHGRMDGDLPRAKKEEMARTQAKWVRQGKRPPVSEGATILVPIPGWPPASAGA